MSNVVPFPQRPTHTTPADPPIAESIPPSTNPAPIASAVYTVAETAHLLSLSLGTTYALIRSGDIPAFKLGNRWLIPKRRLHQWIDGLPEASATAAAHPHHPR